MSDKNKIKEISVSEIELEKLLSENLSVVDPSLIFLGHQIPTEDGILDILAMDKENGQLALIELKIKADDNQLFQALNYYDWASSRIEWIGRTYKREYGYEIDVENNIWLILIAPEFSEQLKKVSRHICAFLNLYEYTVLEVPSGQKYVYCKDIDYGEAPIPPEVPSIRRHVDYITDLDARKLLNDGLEKLKTFNIKSEPLLRQIKLVYKGQRVGRIKCKRNSFKIKMLIDETWTEYYDIISEEYWEKFLETVISSNF